MPLPFEEVPSALAPAAVLLSAVVDVFSSLLVLVRFLLLVREVVPDFLREELPVVRELVPSFEPVVRLPFVVRLEPPVWSVLLSPPVVVVPLPLVFSFVEVSLKAESLLLVFLIVLQSSFRKTGCVPVPLEIESMIGTNTCSGT